jgi:uncharacterized protein YdeI (YjbR/CyaY-like superfamily)
MNPTFFKHASDFREWLLQQHESEKEVWVGLYKKTSGKEGITYDEAVEQALCFGWIDGLTKRVDEISYMIRFTPRRLKSNWTETNKKRVLELQKQGLLHPSGLAAFDRREQK